jgi:hypothetical protein
MTIEEIEELEISENSNLFPNHLQLIFLREIVLELKNLNYNIQKLGINLYNK